MASWRTSSSLHGPRGARAAVDCEPCLRVLATVNLGHEHILLHPFVRLAVTIATPVLTQACVCFCLHGAALRLGSHKQARCGRRWVSQVDSSSVRPRAPAATCCLHGGPDELWTDRMTCPVPVLTSPHIKALDHVCQASQGSGRLSTVDERGPSALLERPWPPLRGTYQVPQTSTAGVPKALASAIETGHRPGPCRRSNGMESCSYLTGRRGRPRTASASPENVSIRQ